MSRARALVALLALCLLTGCQQRSTGEVTFRADGSGTLSLTFAVDPTLVAESAGFLTGSGQPTDPSTVDGMVRALAAMPGGTQLDSVLPAELQAATREVYRVDDRPAGLRLAHDFASPRGLEPLLRAALITTSTSLGSLTLDQLTDQEGSLGLALDWQPLTPPAGTGSLLLRLSFPGGIPTSSGFTVDGTTATVELTPSSPPARLSLTGRYRSAPATPATAAGGSSRSIEISPTTIAVGALLAVLAGGGLLVTRRQRRAGERTQRYRDARQRHGLLVSPFHRRPSSEPALPRPPRPSPVELPAYRAGTHPGDGWHPDPWAIARLRYRRDGAWTGYTHA